MTARRLPGKLAILVLVAAAFGNGYLGGCDGGKTRITTLPRLESEAARALCAWEFRCCSLPEILSLSANGDTSAGSYVTEDECVLRLGKELVGALAGHQAAIRDKRQALDAGAATACVAQLDSRACNLSTPNIFGGTQTSAPYPAACLHAFTGLVPAGGTCFDFSDCAKGLRCSLPAPNGESPQSGLDVVFGPASSSVGVCVALGGPGAICNTNLDCDDGRGLHCRRSDGRCAARATEGQPCTPTGFPLVGGEDPAGAGVSCAANLYCDFDVRVCRHLPRDGEGCLRQGTISEAPFAQCDVDPALALSCVGIGFNGDGVCAKAGGLGDACGGSALAPCGSGLVCKSGPTSIGTCVEGPRIGDACEDGVCLTPGVCNPFTHVCDVPGPLRVGEQCGANVDCASLLCGPNPFAQEPGPFVCLRGHGQQPLCSGVNVGPGFVGGTGGIGGFFGTTGAGGFSPTGTGGAFTGSFGGTGGFGGNGGFGAVGGTGQAGGEAGGGGGEAGGSAGSGPATGGSGAGGD